MFQSIEYLGSECDEDIGEYSYDFKIIDTDFDDVMVVVGAQIVALACGPSVAIIDCYTKRGLPVAPNLIRHMLERQEKGIWSIDDQVKWYKQYNPRWHEVEKDMQLYLLFS